MARILFSLCITSLKKRNWLVVLVVLGILSFWQVAPISAQTNTSGLDISISPPLTYQSSKPGSSTQITLTLKNDGAADVSAHLSLSDFKSDQHTGQPILQDTSHFSYLKVRDPQTNWQTEFLLKSKSEKKIFLDLVVPQDAKEGEYPLTILLSTSRIGANVEGQAPVTGMIGSNLVVSISKDDQDQGKLQLHESNLPIWVDSLKPLQFRLSFDNQGKNATPIRGTVTILDALRKPVQSFVLYPDMVLAQSSREARAFETTTLQTSDLETLLQQPTLVPVSTFIYHPLFMLGVYTIVLDLPQGKEMHSVVALPISILLGIIAIPLLLVTGRYLRQLLSR